MRSIASVRVGSTRCSSRSASRNVAATRCGKYSLGMRQRLALGAALLKDPALLILDEPANGLDPAGIRSVRELLRRLGDEGRTVFVSSHQLSEIQQTCDRVAILSRGHCVTHGTVDRRDRRVGLRRDARRGRRSRPVHSRSSTGPGSARNADAITCASRSHRTTPGGSAGPSANTATGCVSSDRVERSLEELFLEMTDDRGVTETAELEEVDA